MEKPEKPMYESERLRKLLGISREEFSRRYHIPVKTLEDWDKGKVIPSVYVMELLGRAVLDDMSNKSKHKLTRTTPLIEGQKVTIELDGVKYERVVKRDKVDGLFVIINNIIYFEREIEYVSK